VPSSLLARVGGLLAYRWAQFGKRAESQTHPDDFEPSETAQRSRHAAHFIEFVATREEGKLPECQSAPTIDP